jgi:hypothetical protein
VDELIGSRLTSVARLAWVQEGEPTDTQVGPACLVFDESRGLVLTGKSGWTLKLLVVPANAHDWLGAYDYDFEGGRWVSRDASDEEPFAGLIGAVLNQWLPILNEMGELVGLDLSFGRGRLELRLFEGELTA